MVNRCLLQPGDEDMVWGWFRATFIKGVAYPALQCVTLNCLKMSNAKNKTKRQNTSVRHRVHALKPPRAFTVKITWYLTATEITISYLSATFNFNLMASPIVLLSSCLLRAFTVAPYI